MLNAKCFEEQCQSHVSSKETLNNQLPELRRQKHQTYMKEKHPEKKQKDLAKSKILIASDSMMNQIEGTRLSKMYDIKVACWGGCNIRQMRAKLGPILEKESFDYIIINVGTNDSITRTSEEMLVDITELKQYVGNTYHSKVIISNIIG